MTKDNEGKRNKEGEPGPNMEPSDVIRCRECGGFVRRVNTQHLRSDRCKYAGSVDEITTADGYREDLLRPDHPETTAEYKEMYPDAPVINPRERAELAEKARDEEASERRRELIKRRWRGEKMGKIKESLAEKYDASTRTITRDWRNREEWIGPVFGLEDADAVVLESLAQKQDVRERLLRIARQAEDQQEISQAIRALKAVDDNIDETIDHQQNLGKVAQATSKHKVEVEGEVDHRHEAVGDDLDEETLKQLDDITGGDDEEVIDAEFQEVDGDD